MDTYCCLSVHVQSVREVIRPTGEKETKTTHTRPRPLKDSEPPSPTSRVLFQPPFATAGEMHREDLEQRPRIVVMLCTASWSDACSMKAGGMGPERSEELMPKRLRALGKSFFAVSPACSGAHNQRAQLNKTRRSRTSPRDLTSAVRVRSKLSRTLARLLMPQSRLMSCAPSRCRWTRVGQKCDLRGACSAQNLWRELIRPDRQTCFAQSVSYFRGRHRA